MRQQGRRQQRTDRRIAQQQHAKRLRQEQEEQASSHPGKYILIRDKRGKFKLSPYKEPSTYLWRFLVGIAIRLNPWRCHILSQVDIDDLIQVFFEDRTRLGRSPEIHPSWLDHLREDIFTAYGGHRVLIAGPSPGVGHLFQPRREGKYEQLRQLYPLIREHQDDFAGDQPHFLSEGAKRAMWSSDRDLLTDALNRAMHRTPLDRLFGSLFDREMCDQDLKDRVLNTANSIAQRTRFQQAMEAITPGSGIWMDSCSNMSHQPKE